MNLETLRKYQEELKVEFGATAKVAYANVSMSHLSIARHFGSAKIDGEDFTYNPEDDSLIRDNVLKWVIKREREAAK